MLSDNSLSGQNGSAELLMLVRQDAQSPMTFQKLKQSSRNAADRSQDMPCRAVVDSPDSPVCVSRVGHKPHAIGSRTPSMWGRNQLNGA